MTKNKKQFSNGQALLFVVVAVTIALAVGVTVTSRNLSSISRITRTDTAAKAVAAAEGGVERMLMQTDDVLNNLSSESLDCSKAGSDFSSVTDSPSCLLTFSKQATDKTTSAADIKVEKFSFNETDHYWFSVDSGFTKEVVLTTPSGSVYGSNTIKICWDNPKTAILYFSYNKDGSIKRGGLVSENFENSSDISGFDSVSYTANQKPYPLCKDDVSLVSAPYGLRITPLYGSAKIGIFPAGGSDTLPNQGYKITSTGRVLEEGTVKEAIKVVVYRSLPYMPSFFDNAIHSEAGSIN